MNSSAYSLRLVRTLYENVYRARLYNELKQPIGDLEIIPCIPLDRSQVPEDAPEVSAYLLVIVRDADINKNNLLEFEERTSYTLLKRFSTEVVTFQHCRFYYPSPAFIFEQPDSLKSPLE